MLAADRIQDERELLHRRDDDLLAAFEEFPKVTGMLGMPHSRGHLRELLDGVANLPVEHPAVRDHDHRIEDRQAVLLQTDELVCQPGDGVALAAAGRMLDQIARPGATCPCIGEELSHHVELVIAGKDLLSLNPARFHVFAFHDLGVILDNIGEPFPSQELAP